MSWCPLDGAPMRDSPFRIRVGGVDSCDPTAISASGDGLKKAQTGQVHPPTHHTHHTRSSLLFVQFNHDSMCSTFVARKYTRVDEVDF